MGLLTVIHLNCIPSMGRCSEESLGFLDYFLLWACIPKNFQSSLNEPKVMMLSCNLLRRLSLLSDFKIKKYLLWCFHGRVLTDDVHPPENFFQVENGFCHDKALFSWSSVIAGYEETLSFDFFLKLLKISFLKLRQSTWDPCAIAL